MLMLKQRIFIKLNNLFLLLFIIIIMIIIIMIMIIIIMIMIIIIIIIIIYQSFVYLNLKVELKPLKQDLLIRSLKLIIQYCKVFNNRFLKLSHQFKTFPKGLSIRIELKKILLFFSHMI